MIDTKGTLGRPVSGFKTTQLIGKNGTFTTVPLEGKKNDSEKVRVELLPTAALEEIAKVLSFGAKKYDSWNWAKGMAWSRLIGAAMRHLFAWTRGQDKDPETGLSHLAHLGCCVLFLLDYTLTKTGLDDRYKQEAGQISEGKK